MPPSRLRVSIIAYEIVAVVIEVSLTRGMLGTQVLSIDYQKVEAVLTAAESHALALESCGHKQTQYVSERRALS